MDTTQLVPGGDEQSQLQALYDLIARASAWADRITMGSDPSSKGASLSATLTVESAILPVVAGTIRLVCNYRPIITVNGLDIGFTMSDLQPVGTQVQGAMQIGTSVVTVPLIPYVGRSGQAVAPPISARTANRLACVWSYVSGYPHTALASAITAGATSCTVQATDGAGGLLGIIPGVTQLSIRDGVNTESFLVSQVSGTTLTPASPFQFAHTLPQAPDFLPVTGMPQDIQNAAIYETTYLLKTRGDNSMVLQETSEPNAVQKGAGDEFADHTYALSLLEPYRVRLKGHR